jgi:hypothetical protein
MLTYKKKGGDRIRRSRKKKPKSVGTSKYVQRSKQNIIKLPHTNSRSKKQQKDLNRQRLKRVLSKRPRRLLKFPFLPPLLPIFTKPTSTLSHGVGSWDPKKRLTPQEISELVTATNKQTTYLFVSHGAPPQLRGDGKIDLVQNDAFAKMRFGVAANDGGICYTTTNSQHVFITNERTLGYKTTIDDHVIYFESRYPFEYEDKLSFPNLLIQEGYLEERNFFLSGIWRVSEGKIELFGITEVIEKGFVDGIDLTQDDYSKEIAKQDFLARFTNERASRKLFTFQEFIDRMTDDPHFQRAEVVNVLFDTCSGVETKTQDGEDLSRAWRGKHRVHRPYIF